MLIELLLGIEEINRLLRLQSIRYGFCKLIAISDGALNEVHFILVQSFLMSDVLNFSQCSFIEMVKAVVGDIRIHTAQNK